MSSSEKSADETKQITQEAEQEVKGSSHKKPRSQQIKPIKSKFSSLIFSVFIVLLLAISAAVYYYWIDLQKTLAALETSSTLQSAELSTLSQQLIEAQELVNSHKANLLQINTDFTEHKTLITDLSKSQKTLLQTSKNIFDITHRNQSQWLLAEVSYLLSLANQRLVVAKDVRSAKAALRAANNRLHDLADPALLSLRKKISGELTQLNLLKLPDINGIAFTLDNITSLISHLPFKSAQQRATEEKNKSDKIELASMDKDSFFAPLWNKIKSLVTIKRHDRSSQPSTISIDKNDIDNKFRYRIETSRLALINYNTNVFNHEIENALGLLSHYYDHKDNRVSDLVSELENLTNINLLPELPDVTGSWLILQKIIAIDDAKKSNSSPSVQNGKGKTKK